jgi:hypothetical protein
VSLRSFLKPSFGQPRKYKRSLLNSIVSQPHQHLQKGVQ